ncbi:putative elongation factor Tu C-terminal domain [Lyophyllum shimeji]|uniref:Elongation factor 1 alpha-like protein n=1 Tax=Lyophyllum shimeji TaxID=47721 RepID=A0A9P3PDI2_LYOSH|nr:putative elongation factor Tu C-terminal domain [Lyophyllum shimeji]
MSRHRHFRNLKIEDELDDDALSDGGEDYMTEEQHARLLYGLEQVRQVLGDEDVTGLSDKDIKDALWEYFFDEEKTIQWALEEQQRRRLAQERKAINLSGIHCGHLDPYSDKALPPVPQDEEEGDSNAEYYHPEQFAELDEPVERPRVPLVFLHQQQGSMEFSEMGTPRVVRPALSTITERTERTELTPRYPTGRLFMPNQTPRTPSSTFTASSYGEVINEPHHSAPGREGPVDPNLIPVSPSISAMNALSLYEPAPSAISSDAESVRTVTPQVSSETTPPSDELPEIPDYNSKSSDQVPALVPPPKQSKLSLLASSRASSASSRSESSRSSGIAWTGSVKTFPGLRPSAQSVRPTSSAAPSVLPSSRPPSSQPGEKEEYYRPPSTGSSSMSSHVRRAIKTAMELEAVDKEATPEATPQPSSPLSSASPRKAEAPPQAPSQPGPPSSLRSSAAPAPNNVPGHPYKEVDTFRPPSKLALLAQAKTSASRGSKVPKPVTEYLTPTANGPTATTAITTSYQTLYTLTDPSRSRVIPAQHVVPLPATPSQEVKQSKLAAKIKKAHEKQYILTSREEDVVSSPVSPMFYTKPSAHVHKDRASRRREKEHRHKVEAALSGSEGSPEKRRHKSRKHRHERPPVPDLSPPAGFKFDQPSPDDIVFNARPAKEREKALKKTAGPASASPSRPPSGLSTPTKKKPGPGAKKSGASSPARGIEPRLLDLSALHISNDEEVDAVREESPKMSFAREKLLEEAKRTIEAEGAGQRKGVSMVVVGHVDAGKSTLMGRLLYELGRLEEKTRIANERGAMKAGKSSFSWAWGLDGTTEERERGITMDIALQSLATPNRRITILDAPGHKDFIPNMISGAAQADCALLVVDATHGEFESGFERGGQTREHLLLVRSLGVAQVIVAVNKLDQVNWDSDRYEEICSTLRPFLLQSGFHPKKTKFVPVGAMQGVNLVTHEGDDAALLRQWYEGPTLVDLLDVLEPPAREIMAPLRIPISNVFRSHGSGAGVCGRLCGGVVQVGERLRVLPGDETAVVKTIEVDEETVPWAAAGTNATLYLTSVDPVQLHIGSVLSSPTDLVPLATSFTAKIIVFDIQVPIAAGTSVELFHHSRDVPATLSKLISTIDRGSGKVIRSNPRVLTKGTSAEVQISLRSTTLAGPGVLRPIPLETFAVNKDMGRILLRRGGETIGAGIVMGIEA